MTGRDKLSENKHEIHAKTSELLDSLAEENVNFILLTALEKDPDNLIMFGNVPYNYRCKVIKGLAKLQAEGKLPNEEILEA